MKWDLYAYIDNDFYDNKKRLDIVNPTTLQSCGSVSALEQKDIDKAYKSARKAQENWEALPLLKRIEILQRFRDNMVLNREEMANIMVNEIAKSKKSCLEEVDRTIELIDYTFEEAKRINPSAFSGSGMGVENKLGIFSRVAKGVICAISPFNYPLNLAIAKIIPALSMGNVVVFKPATQGSLIGSYLGVLAKKSDFPKSIFQVVTGRGRDVGDIITSHNEIDMISFTGSVNIGNHIKKTGSTTDLVLELGGKDPALVLDDLKLEMYASEIVKGAFGYSGQRCTAIKRVLTTNKIADKLVPLIKKEVEKLKVGDPETNCDITPLIDEKSAQFVNELIKDSLDKKAKFITGNKSKKNLLWPTLIDNVTVDMRLAWEEPFGPVLPIIRLNNIDEMIAVANKSNFGLQASVFCQDINTAINTAKQLKCGSVNLNTKSQRGPDSFPFLGIKDSGVGVQGIRESLLSMTRYHGIVFNY